MSPAQVALAWVSHQPAVTSPIVGATRAAHLEDAIASLALELDEEELGYLAEPYRPHEVAGFQTTP